MVLEHSRTSAEKSKLILSYRLIVKISLHTAVLVGNTQSNMSAPRAQQMTISTANPTPITYRGFPGGKISVESNTIFQNIFFDSPPLESYNMINESKSDENWNIPQSP